MYQFFVADSQIGREFITITGADVNHIKNALRMKPGEKIRISNQNGTDYFCEITEITDSFVQADILKEDAPSTELPSKIYLFQGIPKGDRMETVIEKAVELGVYEIIPVAMQYCVVKLDAKKRASKAWHMRQNSRSAAWCQKSARLWNLGKLWHMHQGVISALSPMKIKTGWQLQGRRFPRLCRGAPLAL